MVISTVTRVHAAFWVIMFFAALVYLTGSCAQGSADRDSATAQLEEAHYAGSASCRSCHAEAYADWKKSDHYLAMMPAHDTTVLGDFNDAEFTADGITSRFFKRNGKFFINTRGEDGTNRDFEVLYTFGYFPLQQYLVAFPGGRMQATRVSWDSRENKWFHQYAGDNIHHSDWIDWTGDGQNWNTMCASCHSTNLVKNYDAEQDAYHTTWDEINVSCESCHGPGSAHIDYINRGDHKTDKKLPHAALRYGKQTEPQTQLNTCAPCHARKSDIAAKFLESDEILDNHIPQVISTNYYHADGQIREEDYEYSSFSQSKMFHNNVRCANCHNPHSGKLLALGNNLCMSCHEPKYNTAAHHFHTEGTESAQCVNCHMTITTYMGNDHRRDHSFRVPRPDQSVKYGTPNACTGCHSKKTNQWAAEAVEKWYGKERDYHFSDDLIPGSMNQATSEGHLFKLVADTSLPEIARATAVYYLGSHQTREAAEVLLKSIRDKHTLVRYHACRSLENFPPELWIGRASAGLNDPVRAVRIAAADLYNIVPRESIPAAALGAFDRADQENRAYLNYQTDFSVGNVMLADYHLQRGNNSEAVLWYERGLKKDSLLNVARLNLAVAYNLTSRNAEALRVLETAAAIEPNSDRILYNIALLQVEMNDDEAAARSFQQALILGTAIDGVYYNYGLFLQGNGKDKEAEQVFLTGKKRCPNALNLDYALAYFYVVQKKTNQARPYAYRLWQADRNNRNYAEIFALFNFQS